MGLSCLCFDDDDDDDDMDWWHYGCNDYSTLATKRGRRCASCKCWIRPGATVARFECARRPRHEFEERIHGVEVPLAPKFMCEVCADLYFSLDELGFCVTLGESMRKLVQEYADVYRRHSA